MYKIQSLHFIGRVTDAPSQHWVYKHLPHSMWAYAQLARWDRPIGWQLLLWPCLWSSALAVDKTAILTSFCHMILFAIGAIAMRGAGCTWNDITDADIDAMVERTRSRPLPSKQITRKKAFLFLMLQTMIGLIILLMFNRFTIILGMSSLVIVAIYPFMKRITSWPQLILGLAFSWGALMGWAAQKSAVNDAALLLYMGTVFWVIGYDTIYAHQDKEDDAVVGVRSTALLFGEYSKQAIGILYSFALLFIMAAFLKAEVPPFAYIGLIAAGVHMMWQIMKLTIHNSDQCFALFKSNNKVGLLIFVSLLIAQLWHGFFN
jgi:4-hydroxybenzoate polyprenyltransferase